ncbi:MAG TPA: sulfate ABC transporter permease subunit CysT [Steroidobacteraceae bacterium]|nr:sulfate ABC transporter permease subunit CysT [Steroidobacteraceae bacterium]
MASSAIAPALPRPLGAAPRPPARARLRRDARPFRVLPGFGLTLGYTLFYVCIIVLLPLSTAFVRSAQLGPVRFWDVVTTPRVLASLRLSFGAALLAALINAVFGVIIAWALTRMRFPGRRIFDAMIDLPFALPTAVAGIALTALYAPNGWIGRLLAPLGVRVAYTPLGVVVALAFVSLPFVVRTLQPVLGDLDREVEGAAETLGASRWQTFRWVVLPSIWPTLLTGSALGFSRALGEYGSVIFIAGNIPKVSEIAPLMIMIKLEQYQYSEATAIAVVMLLASFSLMFGINALQLWAQRRRHVR